MAVSVLGTCVNQEYQYVDIDPQRSPMLSLQDFIEPMGQDLFFSKYFGRAPLYVKGNADRFDSLLPPDGLNSVLSCFAASPNFRLIKEGKEIGKERYTKSRKSWLAHVSTLDLEVLCNDLRGGATIVVNHFEQLYPPASAVARNLERALCGYIDVVLFATWAASPDRAFATHWDHEEVFIVQVAGKKHWRLFPHERAHPTVDDFSRKFVDKQEPYWEGDLHAGDVLYIPSGWWHDAAAVGGPAIHISFGTELPTGVDLAHKIVDNLRDLESLREVLPIHKTAAERQAYMAMLRKEISVAAERCSIEEFLLDRDCAALARTRLSFPWSALPDPVACPLPDNYWVHWLPPRATKFVESGTTLILEAMGSTVTFSLVAAPVLRHLMHSPVTQMQELRARFPNTTIENFVVSLINAGLVAVTSDGLI